MKKNVFQTPILFLIFNRPDTTKLVFESIKKMKPKKLYIAADGPRVDRLGEFELCERTRNIIKDIDWECEVKTLFRSNNLGCKVAVSSAIDWFFENEEQGIILEDDCLPNESFYFFCEELLNYYKKDNTIMHIGGSNFQNEKIRGNASYYFSNYNHIWGWATWRRAWEKYDVNMQTFTTEECNDILNQTFKSEKEKFFWRKIFNDSIKKDVNTWDYQWTYAIMKNKGLSIIPNINLVKNIGFDENGTHTNSNDILGLGIRKYGILSEIIHVDKKQINYLADSYALRKFFNPNVLYIFIRKVVFKFNLLSEKLFKKTDRSF